MRVIVILARLLCVVCLATQGDARPKHDHRHTIQLFQKLKELAPTWLLRSVPFGQSRCGSGNSLARDLLMAFSGRPFAVCRSG
jgi:hypothetical protein